MKENINLIVKGFLIGIAKVIPGVSGSLLALSLGVYEDAIEAISHFFKDIKKNIYFLGKLGSGIVLAIILCSKLMLYFLDYFYIPTMFLFIGLISGGIPSLFHKFDFHRIRNKIIILVLFFLMLLLSNGMTPKDYKFAETIFDYCYVFILGFLDALTMIIPGISGTLVFLLLGVYEFVMYLFGNVIQLVFTNPLLIILLGSGVISGIFLTSLFMNTLFCKHSDFAYTIIASFMMSSLYLLFSKSISEITNIQTFFIALFTIIVGYYIGKKLE